MVPRRRVMLTSCRVDVFLHRFVHRFQPDRVCADAVNFGEAGETKRVLLLDRHFQQLLSIPLSTGPQHHTLSWGSRHEWLPACSSRFTRRSIVRLMAPASEQAAAAKARTDIAATGAQRAPERDCRPRWVQHQGCRGWGCRVHVAVPWGVEEPCGREGYATARGVFRRLPSDANYSRGARGCDCIYS